MKIGILTKEYPPYVYGGAGVHVAALVKELIKTNQVNVKCFGDQNFAEKNLKVRGYASCSGLSIKDKRLTNVLEAKSVSIRMASKKPDVDLIHCHTWYTNYAGFLMKKLYGLPLIITMHSIEPLRPWKREQLGSGYDMSCWMEKLAVENADKVIAVSDDMKINILRCYDVSPAKVEVIYNGITTKYFSKTKKTDHLKKYGINPKWPYLLFVGRITRQKGLIYLLRAMEHLNKEIPLVICAASPDEKSVYKEIKDKIAQLKKRGWKIIHIEEFTNPEVLRELYSHANIFVCPSIYEPFGITNLEAMACETPVVASAVGGIPEVVVPDETGLLVAFKSVSEIDHSPRNPENYVLRLAKNIKYLLSNKKKAKEMGKKGRAVVLKNFTWPIISKKTLSLYKQVLSKKN
ncbi:MAG: glycogen synthase [Patescibacteria group bacterium]|jgi:glycogen synthase